MGAPSDEDGTSNCERIADCATLQLPSMAHGAASMACLAMLSATTSAAYVHGGSRSPSSQKHIATGKNAGWCRYGFSDTRPPQPFGPDDLARISTEPLLLPSECQALIVAAEDDEKGWKESAADRYGTASHRLPALFNIVDVISSRPIVSSPAVYSLLSEPHFPAWEEMLHGLFCGSTDFAQKVGGLRLKFARIVRYRAQHPGERSELGFHQDGPLVTCNIALNEPDEYTGGGTAIQALLPSANLDAEGPGPGGVLRPTEDVEQDAGTRRGAGSTVVLRARWCIRATSATRVIRFRAASDGCLASSLMGSRTSNGEPARARCRRRWAACFLPAHGSCAMGRSRCRVRDGEMGHGRRDEREEPKA